MGSDCWTMTQGQLERWELYKAQIEDELLKIPNRQFDLEMKIDLLDIIFWCTDNEENKRAFGCFRCWDKLSPERIKNIAYCLSHSGDEGIAEMREWLSSYREKWGGKSIRDKIVYVATYDPKEDGDFTQYWPDEEGKFSPIKYYQDVIESLSNNFDPMVPAGATEMLLSELMRIRIQQERSVPIGEELAVCLEELQKILEQPSYKDKINR